MALRGEIHWRAKMMDAFAQHQDAGRWATCNKECLICSDPQLPGTCSSGMIECGRGLKCGLYLEELIISSGANL